MASKLFSRTSIMVQSEMITWTGISRKGCQISHHREGYIPIITRIVNKKTGPYSLQSQIMMWKLKAWQRKRDEYKESTCYWVTKIKRRLAWWWKTAFFREVLSWGYESKLKRRVSLGVKESSEEIPRAYKDLALSFWSQLELELELESLMNWWTLNWPSKVANLQEWIY